MVLISEQVIRLSEELSCSERNDSPEYHVLESPNNNNDTILDKEDDINTADDGQDTTLINSNGPASPTSLELPASPMSTSGDNLLDECENGLCDITQDENKTEDNEDNVDQSRKDDTETAIKRSSSGKSPSKIPRYVGENAKQIIQESTSGKVSYYMSLKRGKDDDGNQSKFFIQVHDLENASPYMQLVRQESNTTIDSTERDSVADLYASPFQTNRNSEAYPEENQRSLLNSVSSLCSNDPSALDVNSLYEALVRPIQSKWKASNTNANNERPQSPPPPLPPRYLDNMDEPLPVPSPPKNQNSPKDVVRTEGQFTSYLPSDASFHSDADSTVPNMPSWVLSNSGLSNSETSLGE